MVQVEAESDEDLLKKLSDQDFLTDLPLPLQSEYVDDSFKIDVEGAASILEGGEVVDEVQLLHLGFDNDVKDVYMFVTASNYFSQVLNRSLSYHSSELKRDPEGEIEGIQYIQDGIRFDYLIVTEDFAIENNLNYDYLCESTGYVLVDQVRVMITKNFKK